MTQPPGPHGPYGPQSAPTPHPHVPSGYPQAPGPYRQAPSPYAHAPVPYAQAPQLPTPTRRARPALVAVAVVLGLALILGASYVIGRVTAPAPQPTASAAVSTSPTPTSSPTPTKNRAGFTLDGTVLSGSTFTARIPDGWTLADSNGVSNDGEIVKDRGVITYSAPRTGTALARCTDVIESFHQKFGGNVLELNGNWGRRATVTRHLVAPGTNGREVSLLVWCVDRPDGTSPLLMSATDTDHVQVAKDAVSLLDSWAWI